ncbi:MAG TPA: polymorphic toxin type 15 domain-containing protein [Bradyrhizobium sp.]|jgi:hypothetical protein|nr:polymorphic toxin type 15 domain-containing protein [Bradyrhizobium sp.]
MSPAPAKAVAPSPRQSVMPRPAPPREIATPRAFEQHSTLTTRPGMGNAAVAAMARGVSVASSAGVSAPSPLPAATKLIGSSNAAVAAVAQAHPAVSPAAAGAKNAPASPTQSVTAPATKAGDATAHPGAAAASSPAKGGAPAKPAAGEGKAAGHAVAPATPAAPGAQEKAAAPAAVSAREAIGPAVAAVHHRAAHARTHRPAGAAVASAQAAAISSTTEQKRAAAMKTVGKLGAATEQTKPVPRDEFKDKLKKAIEDATPKPTTEAAADKLMKTGAADARATVSGQLTTERDAAAGPLKSQSQPSSDELPSKQPAAMETALQPEQTGAAPAPVSPASIAPAPLPPEKLDYSSDREPTDRAMAENNVSKEQLEKGNEPAFGQNLAARTKVEEHEAGAAAGYRQSESKVQDHAKSAAQAELAKGIGAVHGSRLLHVGKVAGQQVGTKTKNAQERQRITDTINGIRDQTRLKVAEILSTMESGATKIFEDGLVRAEQAYQDKFEEEKGGVGTWLTTWGDDWKKLIESSLDKARAKYLKEVDAAVDQVVALVDGKLAAAKACVATGRKQVEDFRNGLDTSVQQFADQAMEAVSADFDAMGEEIDQRRDALVDKLAQQYKSSYERMSAMENKLREENKSLWERIYDATVGLIKKIIAFKNMLLGILAKAAAVIADIIADPIGFLGNLVTGVMQGLRNFMSNIGTHLKKGLMEWVFGALSGAGLKLPDSFDLKGIISIVLQVLGLTYANFRARAVTIVGEPVVSALEQAAEVFKILVTEGVSGLWRFIKEKVEDLKSMVLDAIFDFIKERVLIAGVTWIIGLLNPASAFFKACKAIYDIVMFFIERGSQIIDLVNAIIDSIAAIAKGSIGVAATMVENALAKAIPVAIGFLAGLLGLGDISGTIKKTIEKAQTPVNKAIDWVIGKAVILVKAAGKAIGGLFGAKDKKDKDPHADDPVKAGKIQAGLAEIDLLDKKQLENGAITHEHAEQVAATVKRHHPVFKSIVVVDGGTTWNYSYEASPHQLKTGEHKKEDDAPPQFERPVTVNFKCKVPKYKLDEYQGQLDGQAAGMNNMFVHLYKERRDSYTKFKRPPEAKIKQQQFRATKRAEKIDELMQKQGLNFDQAAVEADKFMKTQAALHEADLVAGGDITPTALGSKYINSSIGSQWRTRISEVDAFVEAHLKKHKLNKKQSEKVRMSVILKANQTDEADE